LSEDNQWVGAKEQDAKLTVFNASNMSADVKVSGLRVLDAPKGWKFTVEVEFDAKIIKAVEKDVGHAAGKWPTSRARYNKQTCDSIKGKYTAFLKGSSRA